ncbi:hypothetical protein PHAVU_006G206700 [Phaseolus vulgaris]|uniref:OCRE domain-containing protein n=1 Tax=Phaseolus vulgaris TaxID=3885 RepID=V7BTN9_PHAVU|nr:hypothetical protein PHAVU_006G206700g [Phaseolus vulgaris]ESW20410.1 hypothetical protein PHAVU_006G206700g [Phaseolus vulgaris]
MAAESSRRSGKRPFVEEDDESSKEPPAKRVRFPKGKKVKPGDEVVDKGNVEEGEVDIMNPRVAAKAAKERANQRNQFTAELLSEGTGGIGIDFSVAEVTYEDSENFVDDGIQIEPFNLDKEREEGYFDAAGNFVEYVRENEIKDAWLDNIEVDPKYSALKSVPTNDEDEEPPDLSSEDIGIMKRRIANVLESGETVLQALRRLKGNSDRKAKMSAEAKIIFDQLTEDAMKLMEDGEYNVYHEKREVFVREAEGYERLSQAKEGTSNQHLASGEASGDGDDDFDMFANDDEQDTSKPSTNENNAVSQSSSDAINSAGALQNDYVYDESSGYYYSSSLGYYYDPNTGLYFSAASGQWYSFNEETNTYEEVDEVPSNVN